MGGDAPRLLDLSRLVSRVGRGAFTGIDRVEAAYLRAFLSDSAPVFGLVRSSFGFTIFDRDGVAGLAARLFGEKPWGKPDLLTRAFMQATGTGRRGTEADLRRLSIARTGRRLLSQTMARHLPSGIAYVNVGHSNLLPSVFEAVKGIGGRSVVMVHDVIPLDYPDWQREGTVESFETRMRQVSKYADLVIHSADATRHTTEAHFSEMGRVPPGLTAHLGIDVPFPVASELPSGLRRKRPYFVVLGTIEPRKNHALLLDVWQALASDLQSEDMPRLYILGARGWRNEAVFARLDANPAQVRELGPLSDGAMAALLQGARALLMPSFIEGYGLPPGEALSLGTPVLAAELPVYREVFGNNCIYLDPTDTYSWAAQIKRLTGDISDERTPVAGLPTWQDHFNLVLKSL